MRAAFALVSSLVSGTACSGTDAPRAPAPDAATVDAAMPVPDAAPVLDAARPDAHVGPCRETPDCFDARPPLRCVGVWRCDPEDTRESSAPGPDGCRYTCVTRLTPCAAAGDATCPEGDACLPCPAGPQCGVARVCVDPAYAEK